MDAQIHNVAPNVGSSVMPISGPLMKATRANAQQALRTMRIPEGDTFRSSRAATLAVNGIQPFGSMPRCAGGRWRWRVDRGRISEANTRRT